MARKQVGKKARFDIFKRDGFRCAYCGQTPPAVTLEVDHIVPVVSGGDNDETNLITACFDCNRGKGKEGLDQYPTRLIETMKEQQEKELQIAEYRKFIKSVHRRERRDIQQVVTIIENSLDDGRVVSEKFKESTIKVFIRKLPVSTVCDAAHLALNKHGSDPERALKYFCGICWTIIKNGKSTI